jgi:uncharacterized membrane protein YjdF
MSGTMLTSNSCGLIALVVQSCHVLFQFVSGILFCLEVVLKLIGLRKTYFNDPWNWFDFFLVEPWQP